MAVTARFTADFASFLAAVDKAEIKLVDFGKGASAVEGKLNHMVDSFSGRKLVQEATLMTTAIEKSGGVSRLTAAELARVGAKATEAAEKMKKMGLDVPPGLQKIADAAKKAAAETEGLEVKLGKLSSGLKTAGTALTAGLTVPLVGIGIVATKAARDFETSFAGVRKTVDGVVDNFGTLTPAGAKLQQDFRDLAKVLPVSVNELNRIGEAAGQLGIKQSDILQFTEVMAKLATTTNLSSDQAANSIARIQNAFGAAGKDTDRLASALVALGNAGASTESEIVEFGLRIAGAGKLAGLAQHEVLGIGNALASLGIEAEAGGTAVQKVLLEMLKAVTAGGGTLETFAKTAGKTAKDFQTLFQRDAAGAFTAFVEGLGTQGNKAILTLGELGLNDARLIRSFLTLAGAGDLLSKSLETGAKGWNDNIALTREAEQRFKTFDSQLKVFQNQLNDVAITIGNAMLPVFRQLLELAKPAITIIGDLAKQFEDMPPGAQAATVGFGAFLAALGPGVYIVGSFAGAIANLIPLMRTLAGTQAAATAITALTTGLGGMIATTAGITGLIAAVGGLSYGLTRLADVASGGKLSGWLTPLIAGSADLKLKQQEVGAGADAMALAFQRTGIHAKSAAEAFALNAKWLNEHNTALAAAAAAARAFVGPVQTLTAATETLADKVKNLTEAQRTDILAKQQLGYGIKAIAKETSIAQDVISAFIKQQHASTRGTHAMADAWADYNSVGKSARGTIESMSASTVEGIKYDLARGVAQGTLQKIYQVTSDQMKAIVTNEKAETDASKTLLEIHNKVEAGLYGLATAIGRADESELNFLKTHIATATALKMVEQSIPPATAGFYGLSVSLEDVGKKSTEIDVLKEKIKAFSGTATAAFQRLPQTLIAAFTGGGGISGALKAFGTDLGASLFGEKGAFAGVTKSATAGLTKLFGGTIGGALGAAIPGIGALIGPAISALWNGIGKLFGNNAEKALNPIREAFVQAAGGLGALNAKAAAAGVTLTALLNAKNPEQYKKAIDDLNKAFEAHANVIADANNELGGLFRSFQDVGGQLPAALQPAIQKLIDMGTITKDNAALFATMTAGTEVDFKKIQAIAEKAGFDITKLGPAFQKARLGDAAKGVINDFDLLERGLGDVDSALTVLRKPINDIVNDAIKNGVAIPANMKPWVDQLLLTGQLTDENGKKLEDISGLKFADPIKTEFQKILDKITELIDALTNGLPTAIRNIPAPKPIPIQVGSEPPARTPEAEPQRASGVSAAGVNGVSAPVGSESPFLRNPGSSRTPLDGGVIIPFPRPVGTVPVVTTPITTDRSSRSDVHVEIYAPITLTSDEAKDGERVVTALKAALQYDTRGVRTDIENVAKKAVA